jgi:hypothetical protein
MARTELTVFLVERPSTLENEEENASLCGAEADREETEATGARLHDVQATAAWVRAAMAATWGFRLWLTLAGEFRITGARQWKEKCPAVMSNEEMENPRTARSWETKSGGSNARERDERGGSSERHSQDERSKTEQGNKRFKGEMGGPMLANSSAWRGAGQLVRGELLPFVVDRGRE